MLQEREEHALFFGQCRAIVLGESLAGRGVTPILDAVYRHSMLPPNSYVVIAKPAAEQVLKIRWSEAEMNDRNIRLFFEDRDLPCAPLKLWHFVQNVLDEMQDPLVPLVEPSADGRSMRILGAAVFRADRAVGALDCAETTFFQILQNTPKRVTLTMALGAAVPVTFAQVHSRTRIEVELRAGRPHFTVRIKAGGNLAEYDVNGPHDPRTVTRLEQKAAAQLAAGCTALLRKLQSLASDPLELGNRVRIRAHNRFSVKKWPALYRRADFSVSAVFRIDDFGKLK